ncbi:hypothetical protein GLOTRDRAFT_119219 [Gloeophyllum trabeum ATCC 11539]|uniref:Uncharacterized protein n=1 Tax=Gloeophyllum trabeum (strain ATCC 11539 / FP-39264 / Madison 617) TaxID=670483 RepID=S7QHX4_GLOTA|nr:uncharacterized protein GLOTRDRAFT_119219 [Gloeophyllum trabeum ATCC 11539]EPQ58797.1 hypothetical protein GLOTRDRAFT_119219 [Gloeophyllum trabeum ATCC 11539]
MSTEAIPIMVTGKPQLVAHPDLPRRLLNGVRPKYEIAHFCFSAEAFADEFPKVIKGESYAVSSGVGTNVGSEVWKRRLMKTGAASLRKPKASVVGGGMTDEEFEQMKSVEGADQIKWVRIPTDTMDRLGPALEGLENDIVKWLDELDIQ